MKTKIAVVDNLPEGGAKRVIYEQIKGLSKEHKIDWYTNNIRSRFKIEKHCSVKRFNLRVKAFSGILRPFSELGLLRLRREYKKIAEQINQSGAVAVLVHPCMITQAPWVLRFITKPKIYFMEEVLRVAYEPELFPVKSLGLFKRYYELLRRNLLAMIDKSNTKAADKLICTSRFVQRQVRKIYKRKSLVLPLGVNPRLFKPQEKRGNKLLFVGQKEPINGFDLVENLPAEIEYVEFENNAFRLTDKAMAQKYAKARAVLCLGRREPFGLVVLEAMSCNTPVIALNEGGYKETVGGHGQLIKPTQNALKAAIANIPQQVKTREHVKKKYNWKTHVKKLKDEIKKP